MLTFAICACVSAVYFGVTLDMSIRFAEEHGKTLLVRVVETLLLMIPIVGIVLMLVVVFAIYGKTP